MKSDKPMVSRAQKFFRTTKTPPLLRAFDTIDDIEWVGGKGKSLQQLRAIGAPVPEGKKSMAFGLSLRAADRTLTDAEADALIGAIRERLKSALGAEIRA